MATDSVVYIHFLLVTCLVGQGDIVTAVSCDGIDACRCRYSDGRGVVDISSIGRLDGKPTFADEMDYNGNFYSYNPCFPLSLGNCRDAAVCKRSGSDYVDVGLQSKTTWSYNGYYPVVTYTSDSGKKTDVILYCDQKYTTAQLDVIGESIPNVVSMSMWSMCNCPNTCKHIDPPSSSEGLTVGSIMLIVFFCLLFVYFVGGMVFNYTRTKTGGKEIIPNFNFWTALPGLILDGFRLSWDFVCRRNKGEYNNV
ncbi:uncharacterized protein LOC131947805 [Physella acuta]|uniref:uncharacterized protein LOC131947805 n=1 Tax=Physella acuta TaxID=109671 RepID=UPI0027DE8A0E|nr:uncharacterized protein LOC131947805 [Physella acuta]